MNKAPIETAILRSPLSDCRTQSDKPSSKGDNHLQCLGEYVSSPTPPMTCSSVPAYAGMGNERFRSREVLLELLQPPSSSKMGSTCPHCSGGPKNQTNCNADAFSFRRRDVFEAAGSSAQPMAMFGEYDEGMPSKTGKERLISETTQHPRYLLETHSWHPDDFQIREFNSEQFVGKYHDGYGSGGHRFAKDLHSTPFTTDEPHQEKQEKETAEKATKEATNHEHRLWFTYCRECSCLNCQKRRRPGPDISGHQIGARAAGKQSVDRCHRECTHEMVKPLEFQGAMCLHRRDERYTKHFHAIPRDEHGDSTLDSTAPVSFCPLRSNHGAWKTPFRRTADGFAHHPAFEERKEDLEPQRHYEDDQAIPVERGPRAKFDTKMTHPSRGECTPVIVECYSLSVMNSKNDMLSSNRLQNTQSVNEQGTDSMLDCQEHVPDRCKAGGPSCLCSQHGLSQSTKYAANQNDTFLSLSKMKATADPQRDVGRNESQHCIPTTQQHNRLSYSLPDISPSGRHFHPTSQHYSHRTEFHLSSMQVAEQGTNVQMESWHEPTINRGTCSEGHVVTHIPNKYQIKRFPEDTTNHPLRTFEYESTLGVQDYYKGRGTYQGICNSAGCGKTMHSMPSFFRQERLVVPGNYTPNCNVFERTACGETASDLSFKQQEASVGSRKRKRRQPCPQRIKPCVIVSTNAPRQQNTSAVQNSQDEAFETTASNQEIFTSVHEASHFPRYKNQRVHAPTLSTPGHHELICTSNGFSESSTLDFQSRGGYWGKSHGGANVQFRERRPIAEPPLSGLDIPTYGSAGEMQPKGTAKGTNQQEELHSSVQSKPHYHSWNEGQIHEFLESHPTHDSSLEQNAKGIHGNGVLSRNGPFKRMDARGKDPYKKEPVYGSRHTYYSALTSVRCSDVSEHGIPFENELRAQATLKCQQDVDQGINPDFVVSQPKGTLSGNTFSINNDVTGEVKQNNTFFDPKDVSNATFEQSSDCLDKEDDNPCSPLSAQLSLSSDPGRNTTKVRDKRCFTNFKMSCQTQRHIKRTLAPMEKERRFHCRFCSKRFAHFSTLQNHLRTHTGDKPFQCRFCSRRFAQSGVLKAHLRTHTGDKPFSCLFCGKMFAQSTTLTNHLRTHTGQKPYTCRFCGKSFSQPSTLRKHELSHTKERPYPCKFCGKAFAQHSTLTNHLRSHTGQKPYKCHFCDKCFAQLSTLDRHLHLHTTVSHKPHACKYCGKSFSYLSNLASHVKHHEQGRLEGHQTL